jgi:hypothetical protein
VFFAAYTVAVGVGDVALLQLLWPAVPGDIALWVSVLQCYGVMGTGLEYQLEKPGFKGWLFGLIFPVAFPVGIVWGVLVFAGLIAIGLPIAAVRVVPCHLEPPASETA